MRSRRFLNITIWVFFLGFGWSVPSQAVAISKVAILLDQDAAEQEGVRVINAVTGAFLDSQRFDVIERARIEAVLRERDFQSFLGEDAQQIGSLVGADYLALINYERREKEDITAYTLRSRVISVRTGQVRATVDSQPSLLDRLGALTIEDAGRRLLESIKKTFPVEGYVVKIQGDEIVVDLGKTDGIKKKDTLEVVRYADPIPHPVKEGVMIPGEERIVGVMKVVTVTDTTALCKLKKTDQTPEVGDRARFLPDRFF